MGASIDVLLVASDATYQRLPSQSVLARLFRRKDGRDLPVVRMTADETRRLGFRFDPGHPRDGHAYVPHPAVPDQFVVPSEANERLAQAKLSAVAYLAMALGARRLSVRWETLAQQQKAGGAQIHLFGARIGVHSETAREGAASRLLSSEFNEPERAPYVPEEARFWIDNDAALAELVRMRVGGTIARHTLHLELRDMVAVAADLAAVAGKGIEVGGAIRSVGESRFHFDIEFWPARRGAMASRTAASASLLPRPPSPPLPLPPPPPAYQTGDVVRVLWFDGRLREPCVIEAVSEVESGRVYSIFMDDDGCMANVIHEAIRGTSDLPLENYVVCEVDDAPHLEALRPMVEEAGRDGIVSPAELTLIAAHARELRLAATAEEALALARHAVATWAAHARLEDAIIEVPNATPTIATAPDLPDAPVAAMLVDLPLPAQPQSVAAAVGVAPRPEDACSWDVPATLKRLARVMKQSLAELGGRATLNEFDDGSVGLDVEFEHPVWEPHALRVCAGPRDRGHRGWLLTTIEPGSPSAFAEAVRRALQADGIGIRLATQEPPSISVPCAPLPCGAAEVFLRPPSTACPLGAESFVLSSNEHGVSWRRGSKSCVAAQMMSPCSRNLQQYGRRRPIAIRSSSSISPTRSATLTDTRRLNHSIAP
jgi:hypothetical protein